MKASLCVQAYMCVSDVARYMYIHQGPKLTFFLGSQLATNLKILVAKWKGLVANDKFLPRHVFARDIRIARSCWNNMAPGNYGDRKIVALFYYNSPQQLLLKKVHLPWNSKCRGDKRLVACWRPGLNFWSPTLNFWSHWPPVSRNVGPCTCIVQLRDMRTINRILNLEYMESCRFFPSLPMHFCLKLVLNCSK